MPPEWGDYEEKQHRSRLNRLRAREHRVLETPVHLSTFCACLARSLAVPVPAPADEAGAPVALDPSNYRYNHEMRLSNCLPLSVLLLALDLSVAGQSIEDDLPRLVELYQHLHSHPELSAQEERTAKTIAAELRKLNFEVTEGVGRYQDTGSQAHGFVAVMRNGDGPVVLIRTDLDALPVEEKSGLPFASRVKATNMTGQEVSVMHACGHDLHMTCFVGTASVLSRTREKWQGTLVMIGQPAEEIGEGAKAMLNDGLYTRFPKPDYALALHASAELESGKIGYRPGFVFAGVDSVDVTIRGTGGHGAYPHQTKDPVVLAAQFIMALQTIVSREISPVDSAVVTVGSIHAGTKHNIIPDEVKLQLTIRFYKPEVRKQILESIERVARGVAVSGGVAETRMPEVSYGQESIGPTFNSPELAGRLASVWKAELGAEAVVEVEPTLAGEDFGYYPQEDLPGCIFWLGTVAPEKIQGQTQGKALPGLHSGEFAPDYERAIQTGVKAMVSAAMDLLRR
jgi:amidohydrolase